MVPVQLITLLVVVAGSGVWVYIQEVGDDDTQGMVQTLPEAVQVYLYELYAETDETGDGQKMASQAQRLKTVQSIKIIQPGSSADVPLISQSWHGKEVTTNRVAVELEKLSLPTLAKGPALKKADKSATTVQPTVEMENQLSPVVMQPTLTIEQPPKIAKLTQVTTNQDAQPTSENKNKNKNKNKNNKISVVEQPTLAMKQPTLAMQDLQASAMKQPTLAMQNLQASAMKQATLDEQQASATTELDQTTTSPKALPMGKNGKSTVADSMVNATAEEKVQQKTLDYTLKIPQIIAKLRKAIAQNDANKVNKWLEVLGTIRRPDDPYLLNMRAYWHMTQQEYGKAETYLQQVLLSNSEDLEAGLNLAIVETHTDRTRNAQQRLQILSQRYPNELRLQSVINTLR